jgi:hypothetical protein
MRFSQLTMSREAMRTRAAGTIAETWTVLGSGKEEFINGSRLVYPLETTQRDF